MHTDSETNTTKVIRRKSDQKEATLALQNNLHAAPVWRNRQSTGLVVKSSQVQYPVILRSCSDRRQVVHTHASVHQTV